MDNYLQLTDHGRDTPSSKRTEVTEKDIVLNLKYLKDPIKLAEFVRKTLSDDNYELAQRVVNEASSTTPCTVSWNHIIEWQLSKGKMNTAIKSYHEVGSESCTHLIFC